MALLACHLISIRWLLNEVIKYLKKLLDCFLLHILLEKKRICQSSNTKRVSCSRWNKSCLKVITWITLYAPAYCMIATSDIKILSWLRQLKSTIFVLSLFHRFSYLAKQPSFFSYYLCVLQAIAYQHSADHQMSFILFHFRQTQALI